jgi:hypothetical protein
MRWSYVRLFLVFVPCNDDCDAILRGELPCAVPHPADESKRTNGGGDDRGHTHATLASSPTAGVVAMATAAERAAVRRSCGPSGLDTWASVMMAFVWSMFGASSS